MEYAFSPRMNAPTSVFCRSRELVTFSRSLTPLWMWPWRWPYMLTIDFSISPVLNLSMPPTWSRRAAISLGV